MFLTGAKVVKTTVTGEDVTQDQLGRAKFTPPGGVATLPAKTAKSALKVIRKLFSFIPLNNLGAAGDALRRPDRPSGGLTQRIIPD